MDVLVYGDEPAGVAAAIQAGRGLAGQGRVVLVRSQPEWAWVGGVWTRGGLAYLDRNQRRGHPPACPFYRELLETANVQRVAANASLMDWGMRQLLAAAGVQLVHQTRLQPKVQGSRIEWLAGGGQRWTAQVVIDATPEADVARAAGLAYEKGFAALGLPNDTLAVSPVFELAPLTLSQLAAIERRILTNPLLLEELRAKIVQDNRPEEAQLLLRNFHLPMRVQGDFADVYSSALGAAYHRSRGLPFRMGNRVFLDRGNVAAVAPDRLSFNGLLFQLSTREVERLVQQQRRLTPPMYRELQQFQAWLRRFPEAAQVQVFPPLEVYVRHLVTVTEVLDLMPVERILQGGVEPEKAIGTFRYAFDARGGIPGWSHRLPPTVTFRYGVGSSLTRLENFAVVGGNAGFPGLAATVGRIEERKVCTGAYLGQLAARAVLTQQPLVRQSPLPAPP
ncbi:MAG: FAD-dependent oxidoreductase [Gloeomargarita sp. SKYBB_i_bin120]|nr:FAD-dependent oxidoreductase [Gloeomargarita sp. SKYG98]MCS7291713.1 FAD-dependent oxidoreductase [Gloeomargarita sp. SKYB120]MDW8177272.1 FAD-dependent oxidoreductase [Gloeomargarita sp. SKYBB_i_bin120]